MTNLSGPRALFEDTFRLWETFTADPAVASDGMMKSIGIQLGYLLDVCDRKAPGDRLSEINIGVIAARFWGWGAPENDELQNALYASQAEAERLNRQLKGDQ